VAGGVRRSRVTRPPALGGLQAVTALQMAEVDRRAVACFDLSLVQMMENAGRALARVARERFFEGHAGAGRVAVLAGPGGNGGGAMVAARRLAGWGARVHVFATAEGATMAPVTARQARTLRSFGVPWTVVAGGAESGWPAASGFDLVLDGLLGYGGRGEPRGAVHDAMAWAFDTGAPVLSLDLPSGLDATSGCAAATAIRASATVTLAALKTGLTVAASALHVGELYLADIGVPAAAYDGLVDTAAAAAWFLDDDVVRVR
jgi:NAD(P)H-hydrate epimerase